MIRSRVWVLVAGVLLLATALGSIYGCDVGRDDSGLGLVYDESLGGETTAFSAGRNAFELSARNLTNEERRTFEVGDSFFNQNWVTAPASTGSPRRTGTDVQCPVLLLVPQSRRSGQATGSR